MQSFLTLFLQVNISLIDGFLVTLHVIIPKTKNGR